MTFGDNSAQEQPKITQSPGSPKAKSPRPEFQDASSVKWAGMARTKYMSVVDLNNKRPNPMKSEK